MNRSMKSMTLGLIAGLALTGSPAANALDAASYKAAVEYCQSIIDFAKATATSKKQGVSINVLLATIKGQSNMQIVFAFKERIARVYAAENPDSEASRIGAECVIAHGLVPVN